MNQSAADQVAAIRLVVGQAKAVPMSASCMVNRAEMLAMLDNAQAAAQAQEDEVRRQSGTEAIADAHAQADQIIADAQARAQELIDADTVRQAAAASAAELSATTQAESDALRREADAYVDQRMAELEAYMSKTLSQLKTLRARLSERSGLDLPSAE